MWNTLTDHLEVLYGAVLALVIVVLLTPAVGGMARMLGVVDRPGARRLNRNAVPRLGGLALFFGIFVPALAFLPLGRETKGLLLGMAVATTVGAIDDFRGLVWWEKLGGQIAAAAIPTGFGIWVHRFTFPILGVHALPEWVGDPADDPVDRRDHEHGQLPRRARRARRRRLRASPASPSA